MKPDGRQEGLQAAHHRVHQDLQKDYQRMAASGRYDMALVNQVGGLLIAHTAQQVLSAQWSDHALIADDEWDAGDRDIHLGGDFLLIYRIDPHPEAKDMEIVIFKRLGPTAICLAERGHRRPRAASLSAPQRPAHGSALAHALEMRLHLGKPAMSTPSPSSQPAMVNR
jgi:mRNA interferase YafQ